MSDWIAYPKLYSPFKRFTDGPHRNELDPNEWSRFEYNVLHEQQWSWTEKVDGTNIRIGWDGYKVRFGGRSDNAQLHADLLDYLHTTFREELFEQTFGMLFGEGMGAGIQKGGGRYSPTKSFALFDVKVGKWWLEHLAVVGIADDLGCPVVPYAGEFTVHNAIQSVSDGYKSSYGDFVAEGLVGIAPLGMLARSGERIAMKVKTEDFLHE